MWLFFATAQFDADKNGHITVSEIANVLKALGESTPGYKIRDMVREVDIDENGTVEFGEFLEVCLRVCTLACKVYVSVSFLKQLKCVLWQIKLNWLFYTLLFPAITCNNFSTLFRGIWPMWAHPETKSGILLTCSILVCVACGCWVNRGIVGINSNKEEWYQHRT